MGRGIKSGQGETGTSDESFLNEDEIGQAIQGSNQLQGNDQDQVHNERQTMAGEQDKAGGSDPGEAESRGESVLGPPSVRPRDGRH